MDEQWGRSGGGGGEVEERKGEAFQPAAESSIAGWKAKTHTAAVKRDECEIKYIFKKIKRGKKRGGR